MCAPQTSNGMAWHDGWMVGLAIHYSFYMQGCVTAFFNVFIQQLIQKSINPKDVILTNLLSFNYYLRKVNILENISSKFRIRLKMFHFGDKIEEF